MGWFKNLIDSAVDAVTESVSAIKEKAKSVIKKGYDTYREIKGKASRWIETQVTRISDRIKRHNYETELLAGQHTITEEKPDQELAENCISYLKDTFPAGIGNTLIRLTPEQREEKLSEVYNNALRLFGVDVPLVRTYHSSSILGAFSRTERKTYLNVAPLQTEYKELMAEQVFTIFHELNHARQWATATGVIDFGYSEQRRAELLLNFDRYIRPEVSDRRYRMQPLEVDSYRLEEKLKVAMNENIL